jgi:hypothetical protein
MANLKAMADQVALRFAERSTAQYKASLFVKIALVSLGTGVALVSQTVELATANGAVSPWTIAGLAGTALLVIGGIYIYLTEQDASKALESARKALEAARSYEQERKDFEDNIARLGNEVTRGLELYNLIDVMRGAIEKSLDLPGASVVGILNTFLAAAKDSLLVALAHQPGDTWTTCIYQAGPDRESGKMILRCIAHDRSIPCDIAEARTWQEGIGVAGVAYSTAAEKIIPDMLAPELGTAFDLKEKARPYDRQRYQSMIAIPIMTGSTPPWGVVVATSSRPGHFSDKAVDGVSTSVPVRAIATMTALAVKSLVRPAVDGARLVDPGHSAKGILPADVTRKTQSGQT